MVANKLGLAKKVELFWRYFRENVILGGMAKSKSPSSNDRPNPEEKKLIEGLRRHPALMERMHSIMDLADNGQATADEIEALLVEEVRRLGANTMESWANSAEQQSAKEFKQQNPKSRYGKKND